MSDILIRGMEMPRYTKKAYFGIDADGNPLCMVYDKDGIEPDIYDVVSLPEGHGRCIDADALLDESCDVIEDHSGLDYVDPCPIWGYSANMISHAPTIVPAERGREDG